MFDSPRFRVKPGALDHIMRTRHLTTDTQLAAVLGVHVEQLPALRAGAPITPLLAQHIATIQGDQDYVNGYCEPYPTSHAAA